MAQSYKYVYGLIKSGRSGSLLWADIIPRLSLILLCLAVSAPYSQQPLKPLKIPKADLGEVAIIYGGNSGGQVVPYPPSDDALGGLSRYASVVSSLRRAYPYNFTIDVGNMLGEASDAHRVELTGRYYEYMKFDAIAPGGGEAAFGLVGLAGVQKRAQPFIVSNMHIPPKGYGILEWHLPMRGGYGVFVVNMLCGSAWPEGDTLGNHDIERLNALMNSPPSVAAHLRVAVAHGSMDEIKELAAALPQIDVIIAGGLGERFDAPVRHGSTLILSAGPGNKFVGCLTMRFDGGMTPLAIKNRLYPVYQDIAPDPKVDDMVKAVSARLKAGRNEGFYKAVPASGVIPFLSDCGGGRGAFIKAIESGKEYSLSTDQSYIKQPIFSTVANRAAFIYGKEGGLNGKLRMTDLGTMDGRTVLEGKNVIDAAFSQKSGFLYFIEADSGSNIGAIYKTKMYMYDEIPVLGRDGSARRDLSVSDDGKTLIFCSDRGGKWQVYTYDLSAESPLMRITPANANHCLPRISPDGKYIAYLSDQTGFGGRLDLWVYDRRKVTYQQITTHANVRDFTWKDDSRTIYFSSGVNIPDINSIDILDKQTGVKKMLPAQKTWSESAPRFIRYKNSPKIVYTREYLNGKKELRWFDTRTMVDEALFKQGDYNEWME